MHVNDLLKRALSLGYNVPGKMFRSEVFQSDETELKATVSQAGRINLQSFASSGALTTSQIIRTQAGEVGGMIISTDGLTVVRAALYDSAIGASGTAIIPPLGVKTDWYSGGALLPFPVSFSNGLYLHILAGAGVEQKVTVYSRTV